MSMFLSHVEHLNINNVLNMITPVDEHGVNALHFHALPLKWKHPGSYLTEQYHATCESQF